MRPMGIVILIFLLMVMGCEQASFQPETQPIEQPTSQVTEPAPLTENQSVKIPVEPVEPENSYPPFYIYSDISSRINHYVPSGFMPNGKCLEIDETWTEGCHEGQTCIKLLYDLECSKADQKWAGIYWLNPPNNWGQRKGGFNLTGASQLTFWAKGEQGGEQIQEFTVGGINGNYPDSDTAVIGPVILTSQWRKYSIDLRGKDLSYISGGFSWSTSEDVNENSCTFYLDEIRFE